MKYIEVPADVLSKISQETLDYFHLVPRYNNKRTKAIMKLQHYESLFPSVQTLPLLDDTETSQEPVYPYPIYESGTVVFDNYLSSEEWSPSEETIL